MEELKKQKETFKKLIEIIDEVIELQKKANIEKDTDILKELEKQVEEKMGRYLYLCMTLNK